MYIYEENLEMDFKLESYILKRRLTNDMFPTLGGGSFIIEFHKQKWMKSIALLSLSFFFKKF